MGLFDHFPYTNVHELNLDWILTVMKALEAEWEAFTAGNSLTFADPLQHDISKTYAKNIIVIDGVGNAYVSLQPVPVGVGLGNQDYWLMVFDYEAFIEKVNKNFTARYYRGQYRATAPMAIGDWLTVDDILCKATAAIAYDEVLEVGVNIEHFTLEDFIKAFMQSATQLIQQYKNDIDASELLYRQQLAQDIANTTNSLQAQLDAAIAGATVDSEVINARVGADGVTYPTLGDAIRTQFEDILNAQVTAGNVSLGDDLNDYTTYGVYNITSSTILASLSNLPHFNSMPASGAILYVVRATYSAAAIKQFLSLGTGEPHLYMRHMYSNGTFDTWKILDSDTDYPAFAYAAALPANTDINTVRDYGAYTISAANMATATNLPDYTFTHGVMIIVERGASSNGYRTQRLLAYENNERIEFIRPFVNPNTFHDWRLCCYFNDTLTRTKAKPLSSGDDFNSIGCGVYSWSSAVAPNLLNTPQSTGAGFLVCERTTRTGNLTPPSYLKQTAYYGETGAEYYRYMDGSNWSGWSSANADKTYPTYWNAAVSTGISKIISNRKSIGNNIVEFFFITDTHWDTNAKNSPLLIDALDMKCGIPDIIFGGDAMTNHATDDPALDEMVDFYGSFKDKHILSTFGNHDNNPNGQGTITNAVLYPFMSKRVETFGVTNKTIQINYYDNETQKVRYIQFDYRLTSTAGVKSLITPLDSSWTVVLISHEYWEPNAVTPPVISGRATFIGDILNDTYNATIACVLVGHVHRDIDTTVNGIPVIGCNTDNYQMDVYGGPSMTRYTDTEQSFDVVQIDTVNKTIYMTRIGAGSDRSFTY